MQKYSSHIALVGNPNSGKTSLFNALTGLNQQVGNFPGVTVDKKTGHLQLTATTATELIDLPGTYSLYPRRTDEWVAYKVLMNEEEDTKPTLFLLVADACNLKRNLLFCSQIIDLKRPVVIALTMNDLAIQRGIKINISALEKELGVLIVPVNPRKNKGITQLKKVLTQKLEELSSFSISPDFINLETLAPQAIQAVKEKIPGISNYEAIHYLVHHKSFGLNNYLQQQLQQIENNTGFNSLKIQSDDVLLRYQKIRQIVIKPVEETSPEDKKIFTDKIKPTHRKSKGK